MVLLMSEPKVRDMRDLRLNVRLNSDMFSRLNAIADGKGLPSATIAALAIADYVQSQERLRLQLELQAQATAQALTSAMPAILESLGGTEGLEASAEDGFQGALDSLKGAPATEGEVVE